jgi:iron complex outermembrane receptor protein
MTRDISVIALMVAAALPAVADDTITTGDNVEEIKVVGQVSRFGATKSDIPILETARSLTVITSREFLEKGALTLDDTLNYTAGVIGDTFGYTTRGDFPRIRGLDVPEYLDNIQVLFGNYNNARSDIYTLEQVEVLRGPASVLYGQGSPGGVLNTISKKASGGLNKREVVVDYGSYDRTQVSADLGFDLTKSGSLSARLVTLYRDSGTQIDYVNDDALVIMPSITYESENTRLTALVNYTERNSDTAAQFSPLSVTGCASDKVSISEANICSTGVGQEIDKSDYHGDPNFNTYDTESLAITLFGEHTINEIFSLEATARYRDNEADYKQTWIAFLGTGNPRVLADGTAAARSWYDSPASSTQYAVDARLRAKFDTAIIQHEVLAGFNYQDVETLAETAYLYALPTAFNVLSPDYSGSEIPSQAAFDAARGRSESQTETKGFYLNDQMSVGNLVVNAGIRYDEVDTFNGVATQSDSATSLSFGGLYKTDFGLNPYISYAESFLAVAGLDNVTNDALKPQRGKQLEVGIKYQPLGTKTYITAAYFDIEQSNLANPNSLPNANSQQEGVAKIDGFELEAHTAVSDFMIDASFSVLGTEDPNGARFPSIPKYQASAWVSWQPSEGTLTNLHIGAGARYASGNISEGTAFLEANGFAPTPVRIETDGYTVFDSLIGYTFDKVALTLNLRNIFDTDYYGTCLARGDCFPGEGRTIMGRMSYNF